MLVWVFSETFLLEFSLGSGIGHLWGLPRRVEKQNESKKKSNELKFNEWKSKKGDSNKHFYNHGEEKSITKCVTLCGWATTALGLIPVSKKSESSVGTGWIKQIFSGLFSGRICNFNVFIQYDVSWTADKNFFLWKFVSLYLSRRYKSHNK